MEPFYVDIIQLRKFEIVFTQAATTAVIHHQTVNANFVLTLAFVSLIAAPPTK
jgi:hypothetical protein